MRVIADLHLHGKYSRATSADMDIEPITHYAQTKGLNLVGTGDFTHPKWFAGLKEKLTEVEGTGLYKPSFDPKSSIRFMITAEVSTIFEFQGKMKKIHHVIITPTLETAAQINDQLAKWGGLSVDGRPTLNMAASELVEAVMGVSRYNEVFPSHAWTPWFSLYGAFSGFDRIEDCYGDMTEHIHALETGLSSDPPMNWLLSANDRFTLVSNSDSHSAWPWRLGREANVFELEQFSYHEIIGAIREKDAKRIKFTVETPPAFGKYHYSGHRMCGVSLSPQGAIQLGNKCPKCGRKLTIGVEQRVEELADRSVGFKPEGAIPFMHLLPLSEIIAAVLGDINIASKRVWEVYNAVVNRFGDEYSVLIDVPREKLVEVLDPRIVEAIIRVREDRVKVVPGYDGVYGKLILFPEEEKEAADVKKEVKRQRGLEEFL